MKNLVEMSTKCGKNVYYKIIKPKNRRRMELEQLMEESVAHLTEEFYKKDFKFSYSSLSKLLWSPVVFHTMYVLGIKEEKEESKMINSFFTGSLMHADISSAPVQ